MIPLFNFCVSDKYNICIISQQYMRIISIKSAFGYLKDFSIYDTDTSKNTHINSTLIYQSTGIITASRELD